MKRNLVLFSAACWAAGILSCTPASAPEPGAPESAPRESATPRSSGSSETPPPARSSGPKGTTLALRGVKPLNENDLGESTPVTVRIFLLKDGAKFTQASVEDVWVHAKDVLGDDVVGMMNEVVILPGSVDGPSQKIEFGDAPGSVKVIGVLGLFPKGDDQGPRKLALGRNELGTSLKLTGYHLVREK
ncbi:MAG TPA: type VI secretion system lipoprotein TssJ [Planctomycetota bacterium]|nr:type VI secretion system lipoprotein TssJ [Planctomycetota bacterium]